MSAKFISAVHVEKLGHSIQEIRERALENVLTKLDRGFLYDNELARTKEIVIRLIDWFKFPSFSYEEEVLKLLNQILHTENGLILINLIGTSVLKEDFTQIKNVLPVDYHAQVNQILELLDNKLDYPLAVPAFEVDVPLSYRTDDSMQLCTTATPYEGFIHSSATVDLGASNPSYKDCSVKLPFYFMAWQPLVAADRHVLESIEDTLRNPTDPTQLLHSFDFFTHVLLHDFPAEVFLQRPAIIKLFHDLLWSCPSSRITTAILKCLDKLTQTLNTRIKYYSDASTHNLKDNEILKGDSVPSTPSNCYPDSELTSKYKENFEETVALMKKQMSLPQYCLNTIHSVFDYLYIPPDTEDRFKRKKCKIGINTSLMLLNGVVNLLTVCVKKAIWDDAEDEIVGKNIKRLKGVFEKYAEVLDFFRFDLVSRDWDEECRISHLHLLYNFVFLFDNIVPIDKSDSILPRSLKNAISSSILDPALSRLFPTIHETLLQIIKEFSGNFETDAYQRFKRVEIICQSMSSAVEFLKNWKSSTILQNICLAKKALPSLEFHKDKKYIQVFIDICSNKLAMHTFEDHVLNDVDYIINVLLSHKLDDIKLEAYKLCHKRIIATVGAKLNVSKCSAPGSQILFLLRPKVLLEIITHGIVDLIPEVQNYADDILLHIIKSKILVSDDIWQRTVEALVPNIPILLCHANKSNLGRTIMNLLDPDRSRNLNIPLCEIIRGNVGLLFCENSHIREEAVSRLCWILTSTKEENRDLLPRINNLHDRGLGFVCCVEKAIDYNKYKATQHFYQPSSLCQVMELLSSKNVEPVIRRSAITQVSVMMEDPMLHRTFLDRNGVNLLKAIMEAALTEDNYKDYPDSVIPSISILKNICLYNACVRQELSYDIDAYHFILRALFMFFTEERVKQDGSILLHLMVNASFVLGNPIKSDLSLPQIILNKIKSPFHCHAHWKTSENCLDSLNDLLSDRWTLITLQIHWNIEWFGGLEKLVELDRVTYSRNDNFDDVLKLKNNDLLSIKSTCLSHCMKQHLYCIQLAESHEVIKDQLNNLTNCVNLYTLLKDDILEDLLSMPWEKTFEKFLNTPPPSPEDNLILAQVFQFLTLLVPTLKGISGFAWIQGILKNRNHMICDLLSSEEPKEPDTKLLMHGLLDLIITCVCAEQNYLDFHIVNREDANESGSQTWSFLVEIIAEHLKFNDAQHFYNLAYLDHLLSVLVHLTSHLGWSRSKPKEIANKLLEQLSLGLFEMIGAFHCGKGSSAADSLMGLSITKHLVLILNHLLGEVQHMHVKNWEEMFLGNDINGQSTLASLGALQLSRDVILRAAILHFFAGIAVSPKTVTYLVNEVTVRGMNIWESNILIVLDHEEASVVKENAAMLMTNLISHVTNKDDDCQFLSNIFPSTSRTNLTNGIKVMYDLLDGHSFFKELEITLKGLYLDKHFYSYDPTNFVLAGYQTSRNVINSSRSASSAKSSFVSTPSFIKTICMFIYNITRLSPQDGCSILQDYGLFRLFLRCISMPHSDIETTKDLALYCDIIEMNTSILQLVTFSVSKNYSCLIATCNTRDCLTTIVSLLNPKLYYVTLPQLLYLRNKMWSAIYNLIEVILENCRNEDGVKSMDAVAVLSAIISEKKQETFIQSLCESMSCRLSNDLQLSAMSSFTSLLRLDSEQESNESSSMQNLLDFTKTPRSFSEEVLEMPKKDNKLTVLQTVYFSSGGDATVEYPPDTSEMAGAELCKILLNMYDFVTLKNTSTVGKKRIVITNALMSLLSISSEAKMYALRNGFLLKLVTQLKEIYVKLSLESVECLRRVADKKRVCPVLKELELVLSLFTNFMGGQEKVKVQAVHFGLADTCHKLWIWFSVQKHLMVHAMKMLCTFTTKCPIACQSLTLTSPVAGSGPRKVTSNMCLLQAICTMVGKEMEMISKTHDLTLLQLSFHLLHNSLDIVDCRIALSKNNFLQTVTRLHPAITKRQKPWESIETLWLEFLNEFTSYVEGQTCVAKLTEVFELLMTFASSSRGNNKRLALEVLKNISFYQPNRPRLLTSDAFVNILSSKLSSGSQEEKNLVVLIVWSLAANSQKAKLVFKCAHIDDKLQESLKLARLSLDEVDPEDLKRMQFVLNLLKEDKR